MACIFTVILVFDGGKTDDGAHINPSRKGARNVRIRDRSAMTDGDEVVCDDGGRKVEIEEKCVSGLETSESNEVGDVATVDCNVGGGCDGNVRGTVLISGGVGPGGTVGVHVDDFGHMSDSVDEVDEFEKEELGVEEKGISGDPLVSETEAKAVKDGESIKNGSIVDPPVVLDTNADKVSGEEEADVKGIVEVEDTKEMENVEVDTDGVGSGFTFVPETTLNAIESSQVTDSGLESVIKQSDVTVTQSVSTPDVINRTDESLSSPFTVGNTNHEVMVIDEPKSISDAVDKIECQVTAHRSGKLEFQVAADESESSESAIEEEWEGQATFDGSGKPAEELGSQVEVTADELDSCGRPIKDRECEVPVDRSDFIVSLVDNQQCPVSVIETESSDNHTQKVKSKTIVMELDGKSEEHQELLVITSDGDGCLEKLLEVTESVEMDMNIEEMKKQVKVEDVIQESKKVVTDIIQDEAEVSSEIENSIQTVIHEDTSSQYAVGNCIDKPQERLQQGASAENVETTITMESECDNNNLLVETDSLSNSDDLTVVEQKVEILSHLGTENTLDEGRDFGTGIENVDVSDDHEKETEVKVAEDVLNPVTEIRSGEAMGHGTGVETVVSNDEKKEIGFKDARAGDHSILHFSDTIMDRGAMIEFGSIGRHEPTASIQNEKVEDKNSIQSDEIPSSCEKGEGSNAIDVQDEEVEVLEYNFLIKIPRYEDENLKDQIRSAQALVDEKTQIRDAIRDEILEKRAKMKAYNEEYNAARIEENAARRLVQSKRQEIDSVMAVINRYKNAMSIQEIDYRIEQVEHMIQHETWPIKDEKQMLCNLNQFKTLRKELASNMGTDEEIRYAIDTKDHNEERMKTLRKELDALKVNVSKAEAFAISIGRKYQAESRMELELLPRFRAADGVRQHAYTHLNSLKKLSYDKNENFRQYKEDLMTARDFASNGDQDALHQLCANQVETFMEQWNNNDEFRNDYVSRCNVNASRRQRALDGALHVPHDALIVPLSNEAEKVDGSLVTYTQNKNADIIKSNNIDNKTSNSIENASGQNSRELKNNSAAKPTNLGTDGVAKVEAELAEIILTNEEIEVARKAEELRNEEIAAKLKEQRRQEEKAKAIEALERKKRNAEKAQLRAELRARKEAEQKEKEREKRLRKKEKKTNGEDAPRSETSNGDPTEETETKKKTLKPPAHFFSQQLKPKSVPPPVLNKNKKRLQQWGRALAMVLAAVFVFTLTNSGYLFDFKYSQYKIRI